jgi:F-type H+-transporting ATPase subunit c
MSKVARVLVLAVLLICAASGAAFAEGAAANEFSMKSAAMLGAGAAIGLAVIGGALAQGRAVAAALDGICKNPAASGKVLVPMILGLALIESLVIYALIIAFALSGKG